MNAPTKQPEGFTTVELLITLFVAAAFITTGYQLYIAIISDSANMRQRTTASNLAQDYLKRRAAGTYTCNATTPTTFTETTPPDTNLPNPAITSIISAPYGCPYANNAMRVQVTVKYGATNQRKEVVHGTYVGK